MGGRVAVCIVLVDSMGCFVKLTIRVCCGGRVGLGSMMEEKNKRKKVWMVGELVTLVRKLSSEEKRLWSGRTCELLLRTVITGHQFQHYQPYAKFQGSLVTFFWFLPLNILPSHHHLSLQANRTFLIIHHWF